MKLKKFEEFNKMNESYVHPKDLLRKAYDIFLAKHSSKFQDYEVTKPTQNLGTKEYYFSVRKSEYSSALGRDANTIVRLYVRLTDGEFALGTKRGYTSSLDTSDPQEAVSRLVDELKNSSRH